MKRLLIICCSLLLIMARGATAQSITAPQILEHMKRQFEIVKDYSVTLKANVDMERIQIPDLTVVLYFKQPDKIHVESKSTTLIPRELVALNPAQYIDKFDATIVETSKKDNVTTYQLRLVSKPEKGKPVRELYVWIDGDRWVIKHFESTTSEVRKISIDFDYDLIDGKYTLPAKISAHIDIQQPSDSTAERMYSPQRMPRKGNVTLIYSDYKVNTNLPDEIFEKKKEEKKDEKKK